MDYLDLIEATNKHNQKVCELNDALKKKQAAEVAWLEKQKSVRITMWKQVTSGEITQSMFDKIIKNECFTEEVEYKKLNTEVKILENQLSALRESLYTIKKQIVL